MFRMVTAFRPCPLTIKGLCYQLFSNSSSFLQASSCNVSVIEDGKKLKLLCDGEIERRYHGVWLRHNCRCPECFPAYSQQNIVHHSHLVDLKLTNANVEGDHVKVHWNSITGQHSCEFKIDWLKEYDYTTPGIHAERKKKEVPLIAESIPTSDYYDIISSNEKYFEWMKQVNFYGISLLKNVPTQDEQMLKVCERIGEPQPHVYRSVYDVFSVEDGTDASYSCDELLLHMDQNFFESPPGIQILHCLRFDECVEGGESVFVDTYPVVEELRRKHPKLFEVLTRIPYITYRTHHSLDDQDVSVSFKYSHPHISLDSYNQIRGISWSPQFHSPLLASENEVEEYYEAFVVLSTMFEESPLKIQHRLKPGDCFVFNNRRMLHSRNAFNLNGGKRHLRGFYINIDFFRSKLEVMSRQLNKKESIKHLFNHSYVA